MRAFISYSLNDQDLYILTLLSAKLKKEGLSISQSSDFDGELSSKTKIDINKSDLFIGIITDDSFERERIMKEWRLANVASIPSILLIEDTVSVNDNFNFPIIRFNRNQPEGAIDKLNKDIKARKDKQNNKDLLWVLGGIILVGIIGLLARKK